MVEINIAAADATLVLFDSKHNLRCFIFVSKKQIESCNALANIL